MDDPVRPEWVKEHVYLCPGSLWTACFHDPFEWRMGADGWKLSLFHDGADATSLHRYVSQSGTDKGYYLPHSYQPWCSTRPVIALNAWDNVIRFYDVGQWRSWERPVPLPFEVQWSPRGETLAITLEGRITLLDIHGQLVVDVPVSHPPGELTQLFWWPDGKSFFVAGRTSPESKTTLSFVDSADGRLLEQRDFDPADLLPYDVQVYRKASRSGLSLRDGRGIRSVGDLLDKWSRIQFDPEAKLLRAVVYRPIGPPEPIDGQLTCAVEEREVEVALGE